MATGVVHVTTSARAIATSTRIIIWPRITLIVAGATRTRTALLKITVTLAVVIATLGLVYTLWLILVASALAGC